HPSFSATPTSPSLTTTNLLILFLFLLPKERVKKKNRVFLTFSAIQLSLYSFSSLHWSLILPKRNKVSKRKRIIVHTSQFKQNKTEISHLHKHFSLCIKA
ncbi:hypothetical protein S83_065245, partial [Arachis hypogaea]